MCYVSTQEMIVNLVYRIQQSLYQKSNGETGALKEKYEFSLVEERKICIQEESQM